MGDEGETRLCGHCKKEVAEVNFALHESHCKRFLVLCPDCEENVPRSELETHKEEQHARVRCPKCHKKMEKRLLAEHEEEECPSRVVPCVYCELEMAWSELQEHAVACGSRTEMCPDCGRYVRLSDRDGHSKTCSDRDQHHADVRPARGAHGPTKTTTRKIKVLCKICMMMFPAEEIKKHEVKCTADPSQDNDESDSDLDNDERFNATHFVSRRFGNMFLDRPQSDKPNSQVDQAETKKQGNELGICPHCQLLLPLATLRWHEKKCILYKNLKRRGDNPR